VKNRSRGAFAPELCQPPQRHGKNRLRPTHDPEKWRPVFGRDHAQKKGGEAPKGACQPCPRGSDGCRHPGCLPRGCAPLSGARPPSGASPRHSPKASTPMAQPQNRVSSRHGEKSVLPARRRRLELSTLRADRSFCRPTGAPGPPGSGSHPSARGHRIPLRFPKVPSRKAPLDERDFYLVSEKGTNVNIFVPVQTTSVTRAR
jgi:hypothetical protein